MATILFPSVGFVHLLMFNATQAVDYFHKALGIRRDDTFSTAMLEQALEMMLADLGLDLAADIYRLMNSC